PGSCVVRNPYAKVLGSACCSQYTHWDTFPAQALVDWLAVAPRCWACCSPERPSAQPRPSRGRPPRQASSSSTIVATPPLPRPATCTSTSSSREPRTRPGTPDTRSWLPPDET